MLLSLLNGEFIEDVADLFGIRVRSIYRWMDRWRDMDIVGLGILKGAGQIFNLPRTDDFSRRGKYRAI